MEKHSRRGKGAINPESKKRRRPCNPLIEEGPEFRQRKHRFERQAGQPPGDGQAKYSNAWELMVKLRVLLGDRHSINTKKWGVVEVPLPAFMLTMNSIHEGNSPFYLGPSSTKGMNPDTWPPLLRESLKREEEFVGEIMEKAGGKGSFLELGCGIGRYLPAACAHFERVTGIDISPQMIKAAAEYVALNCGPKGAEKTSLYLADMADFGLVAGWQTIGMALGGFNTFPGNLTDTQKYKTLMRLRDNLKRSKGGYVYPLTFSAYIDAPKTRAMQEEFYRNMGLTVVTTEEDARMGFSVSQAPDGSFLKSQRAVPEKLKELLVRAGFRVRRIAQLSEAMIAVVATVEDAEQKDLNKTREAGSGLGMLNADQLSFQFNP